MANKCRSPRVGKLDTVANIRSELAKIYRLTRRGGISTEDMGRYAQTLRIIAELVSYETIEKRLDQTEKHVAGLGMREATRLKSVG